MGSGGQKTGMTERLWNVLGSMRFVIFLFILWAAASLLAIYLSEAIPVESLSESRLIAHLGPEKYRIYRALGFLHPYQSFWYRLILGLLTFSLAVCILDHLGRTVRWILNIRPPREGERGDRSKILEITEEPEVLGDRLRSAFRFPVYRTAFSPTAAGGWRGSVRKGEIYKLGPILVHLGLVLLVVGGLISSLFGFSLTMWGKAGSELRPPGADFTVRVDSFEIVRDSKGRIKDYLSTLSVYEGDRVVLTRQIEVNSPLNYRDYIFYQSSWKQEWAPDFGPFLVKVSATGNGSFDTTLSLPFRRRVPLKGGDYWVEVEEYYPDFFLDSRGKPGSRSPEPRNPAIRLAVYRERTGGVAADRSWSFLYFPGTHFNKRGLFTFRFLKDLRPAVLYTGIQVAKHPGSEFIWAGLALGTLGLFAAFFIPYRRYSIFLEPVGGEGNERRWELSLSVKSNRKSEDLEPELTRVISRLTRRLVGS